jgi:hypothetical protein
MASIQPGKRSNSPEESVDPEKGLGTIFTPKEHTIEVVVHKPTPQPKKPLTGNQVLAQAMGLKPYGGKKSRKQKKRVQKKTQKRRARK